MICACADVSQFEHMDTVKNVVFYVDNSHVSYLRTSGHDAFSRFREILDYNLSRIMWRPYLSRARDKEDKDLYLQRL